MKKQLIFIVFITCYSLSSYSQPEPPCMGCPGPLPNKYFNYQALIRNSEGSLIVNAKVSLLIKLVYFKKADSIAFIETHKTSTNAFGLVTLHIGNGNWIYGNYFDIDWSKYLAIVIEIDDTEAGYYHPMGVSQLFSVPYSLYSYNSNIANNLNLKSPNGADWQFRIDNDGNLTTENIFVRCGDRIYDIRDGKFYKTVKIANQCWMAENLNIGTMINGDTPQIKEGVIEKYCYNNLESNCDIYGGLYQWSELFLNTKPFGKKTICPVGWHMPTLDECKAALKFYGPDSLVGGYHKEAGLDHWLSPNKGATNQTGFTALPGGDFNGTTFEYLGEQALFYSDTFYGLNQTLVYYMKMTYDSKAGFIEKDVQQKAYSVRCMRITN